MSRLCRCEIVMPSNAAGSTIRMVTVLRFQHPWLPTKTMIQTVDQFWQGLGTANPYTVIVDRNDRDWPSELLANVASVISSMLNYDPRCTALRITDGTCPFHGHEGVNETVLQSARKGMSTWM